MRGGREVVQGRRRIGKRRKDWRRGVEVVLTDGPLSTRAGYGKGMDLVGAERALGEVKWRFCACMHGGHGTGGTYHHPSSGGRHGRLREAALVLAGTGLRVLVTSGSLLDQEGCGQLMTAEGQTSGEPGGGRAVMLRYGIRIQCA